MNKFQEFAFVGAAFGASLVGAGCSGDNTEIGEPRPACTTETGAGNQGDTLLLLDTRRETAEQFRVRVEEELGNSVTKTATASCARINFVQIKNDADNNNYSPVQVILDRERGDSCVVSGFIGEYSVDGALITEHTPSGDPLLVVSCAD